jgi:Tol biopolymer transport system component
VLLLDLASGQERALGAGCDPAFSPDGKRVAFATAPSRVEDSSSPDAPLGVGNAIRLVNRQGQNGWNFATAGDPAKPEGGKVVFAPAWSPDGRQLAYQRFVGYQALVDILYTEIGNSFAGKGQKIAFGAGWLLSPRISPVGGLLANIDNNDSDARGWGGYEQWSVEVMRLGGQRNVALPEGPTELASTSIDQLARAQQVAWSPDGVTLAVQLPSGWQPNLQQNEPLFTEAKAGELWRWVPGRQSPQKLTDNVDFASPLLWLPAAN